MRVDLRGFHYRLEPARRLARWRLSSTIARLGDLQRSIDEATRRIAEVDSACDAQARRLTGWVNAECDPSLYASGLQWIVRLHRERHAAQAAKDELLAQRRRVRSELVMEQARVDTFDAHRNGCETVHAGLEVWRQATEADRDWLARSVSQGSNITRGEPYGE
jgi:hypothetical protein